MNKVAGYALALLLPYVIFTAGMYAMQRSFIYHPDQTRPGPVDGVDSIEVVTDDGVSLGAWFIPPAKTGLPVIVFFHGNAGHYGHRLFKAQPFVSQGYGVLLAGYRGYGGNGGRISEHGFYADGRAYMKWLRQEKRLQGEDIVIYGESIGSGTAVQIATEHPVAGLVLEAPFTSLTERAAQSFPILPVSLLLKDRFDNLAKIRSIDAPLLILHGVKDRVVPFSMGRALYEQAVEPKAFAEFPHGGHNNLYELGATEHVLTFLSNINSQYTDSSEKETTPEN